MAYLTIETKYSKEDLLNALDPGEVFFESGQDEAHVIMGKNAYTDDLLKNAVCDNPVVVFNFVSCLPMIMNGNTKVNIAETAGLEVCR